MLIHSIVSSIQEKSQALTNAYSISSSRECALLSKQKNQCSGLDSLTEKNKLVKSEHQIIWNNFKTNLDFLKNNAETGDLFSDSRDSQDKMFQKYVKQVLQECDRVFSSEESYGKYLDLNAAYQKFVNIKQLQKYHDQIGLPADFLTWLQCFDKILVRIPFNLKD